MRPGCRLAEAQILWPGLGWCIWGILGTLCLLRSDLLCRQLRLVVVLVVLLHRLLELLQCLWRQGCVLRLEAAGASRHRLLSGAACPSPAGPCLAMLRPWDLSKHQNQQSGDESGIAERSEKHAEAATVCDRILRACRE